MTNRTYSDLLALITALAGVDSFTTQEQAKVVALVNRRIKEAYNASKGWPRYTIAAQARPANDGLIARSYDEVAGIRNISSATRAGTTVTVVCTASVSFVAGMRVTIAGLSGTVNPNGAQTVTEIDRTTIDNDTFTFTLNTTNTGSETYTGSGTVSPVAIPDIHECYRVWSNNPFSNQSGYELEWTVDSDGIRITGDHDGLEGYWLAFRSEWGGPYTSASTDIPEEFFWYVAHAAYADFLRMDDQVQKAATEEQIAQGYLAAEIQSAENSRNTNKAFSRVRTHLSTQSRW